jgi:hypothetical protein
MEERGHNSPLICIHTNRIRYDEWKSSRVVREGNEGGSRVIP